MAEHASESADRIRSVLLHDWDPHNAIREEAAHGSYDVYIAPLQQLLDRGADEDTLTDWLKEREEETMCFPSLGTRRLRRVAQKLLDTRPPAQSPNA